MTPTRLPVKISIAFVALVSLFIYAGFVTDPPSKSAYSTWEQYGGGPDQSKYFNASEITKENVKPDETCLGLSYNGFPAEFL
jgi:quinoprotein glucose dehydrogenase